MSALERMKDEGRRMKADGNAATRAVQGGLKRRLSRKQIQALLYFARLAFTRCQLGGDALTDFEDFRQTESVAACGRRISKATQADYNFIKARFQSLAGDSGSALATEMRGMNEGQRQAMNALQRACEAAALPLQYATSVCRDVFHCALASASAEQLRAVAFTVTNRARSTKERGPLARDDDKSFAAPTAEEEGQRQPSQQDVTAGETANFPHAEN